MAGQQPTAETRPPWEGLRGGLWTHDVNVRDFIQQNYRPYVGDETFLAPATERTAGIWKRLNELFEEERRKGVLDVSQVPSSITAHGPGYIDRQHRFVVKLLRAASDMGIHTALDTTATWDTFSPGTNWRP